MGRGNWLEIGWKWEGDIRGDRKGKGRGGDGKGMEGVGDGHG